MKILLLDRPVPLHCYEVEEGGGGAVQGIQKIPNGLWVSFVQNCTFKRSENRFLLRFLKENRWS